MSFCASITKYFTGSVDTKHAGVVIRSTNRTNWHIICLHINTKMTRKRSASLSILWLSVMSYGTRKAMAGAMKATSKAEALADEAIKRFDACRTPSGILATLSWMKTVDFFFLPSDKEKEMRSAFHRARNRIYVDG